MRGLAWPGLLAAAALGAAWAWAWLFWGRGFEARAGPTVLLRAEELRRFSGEEGSAGLYLALLGEVFDVSSGRRHYGPGGAYSFFAGRDASRAFATGDFSPSGLTDDLAGLSPSEALAIQEWLHFYRKNYAPVGKVSGRFYDAGGAATEALHHAEALAAEGGRLRAEQEEHKRHFPPCNAEWSAGGGGGGGGGSRVWCSKHSGGVSRDWSGVPRRLQEAGSVHGRCVCVQEEHAVGGPGLEVYEGCPPFAHSCAVKG
ncbi:neuferricin [Anolis carolinensis]|uniref:neuferricin n=1 Tax=Anolis carolinensis TaxID=28377 RepID=UPI002F2B48F6